MIADILSKKELNPVVTELFIKGRKLNISLVFITEPYFAAPKNFRLNSTNCFIMKILNKQELQQITFNHSSDIHFKDIVNLFKKFTGKPYSFLLVGTTLASNSSSHFRENLFGRI